MTDLNKAKVVFRLTMPHRHHPTMPFRMGLDTHVLVIESDGKQSVVLESCLAGTNQRESAFMLTPDGSRTLAKMLMSAADSVDPAKS